MISNYKFVQISESSNKTSAWYILKMIQSCTYYTLFKKSLGIECA